MNPQGNAFIPCAACGRRRGAVEVVYAAAGGGRVGGLLCESCARRLMAAQSQAAGPAAQRGEAEQASKTPGLDEFGRDLTAG